MTQNSEDLIQGSRNRRHEEPRCETSFPSLSPHLKPFPPGGEDRFLSAVP